MNAHLAEYLLSLPERVIRSASALAGGLLQEIGNVTLPAAVRRSRLYRNLVALTLRFMIEQVGQVDGVFATRDSQLAGKFLARRTAGNGIEFAGILVFHASPVWVLAALADLSGAGRHLIQEISESLKQEGLLERDVNFESVDQILDGLERTSGHLASTLNTPPLDIAGLRRDWLKLVANARRIPPRQLPSPGSLERAWQDLALAAREQDRSVFELSSMMAVSAVARVPSNLLWLSRVSGRAALHTGRILAETLLDHYGTVLIEIQNEGLPAWWTREFRPYLRAAAMNFAPSRLSLTERWLSPRRNRPE